MIDSQEGKKPFYMILLLILAGESIFILPFVLARVFRPTFLDVFQLNNLQLGTCFSIYGIVAFFSYLFGGPLADKFKPRILITLALFLTAIGGLFMATYPSYFMMKLLFGYWGFTTIFLFWGAMIKATRIWGGKNHQSSAFGFLEGGRGLVAASMGTIGVFIYALFIEIDLNKITLDEQRHAFRYVILFSTGMVALIGLLTFLFMKTNKTIKNNKDKNYNQNMLSNLKSVLKIPSVWLLMIIIMCAYVGYKLTDVFSLYAREVMLYNEVKSAQVGTFLLYMRPIVAVSIGLIADKTRPIFWLSIGFLIMFLGALIFASGIIDAQMHFVFFLSIIIIATGTYAIRTLYFAVLQIGHIPLTLTGTAVGIISLVGFTPDIFVGPIMGYFLDSAPGETGHQHVFIMLSIFAIIGLLASVIFNKINIKMTLKSKV